MKVIFHLFKMYLIVLSSNRVDLQFLGSKFALFQLFHYNSGRAVGRPAGWPATVAGELNTKANSAKFNWDWG